jgi:hypothetical protein
MELKQEAPASAQKTTLINKLISKTPLRRILATGLATAMLYCATPQFSRGADTPKKEEPVKQLILPKPQAPKDIYQFYMDTAISYAKEQNPESQQKASELFTQAIELDKKKAISFDTKTLDETTAKLYTNALQQELAKDVLKSLKNEDKKEKSWMSRNWPLVILGVGAAAAGVYFLTKKKNDTTPPPPIDVTINLDAYNSTKGLQKSLEARTVKAGSTIDIPITETGVTGVDAKYVAVYSEDFKTKIAFDTDSSATFTAPQSNAKYHIILFDKLGTNLFGQQVSYGWMLSSSLQNNKRNHIVYRKDFDGQTGPEKVWGGEYIPLIKANGVFDQLNSTLNVGYTTWGHVDRQPNGTSGDFSYGYGESQGASGLHAGSFITVNAKINPNNYVGTGLEEAFENICNVDDIGDHPTAGTIEDDGGVLNPVGKALFVFVYIKDDSGFTTTTNNTMANAMSMVNVNQHLGPVEIGMSSGSLHTGFKNKNLGVRTSLRRNGRGFENYTTANFTGEKFQAGLGMLNSPNQQIYTAQATMNLDKIMLGASGGYDAKAKQGNVTLSIGAPITKDTSIMLGVAGTPGMLGFNAQATQALKDVGILGFRGIYTKNGLAGFTALGLDAQLDKTPIGPIRIISDYTKSGMYKAASLGIAKPIGPGVLSFSIVDAAGQRRSYDLRYTTSIKF